MWFVITPNIISWNIILSQNAICFWANWKVFSSKLLQHIYFRKRKLFRLKRLCQKLFPSLCRQQIATFLHSSRTFYDHIFSLIQHVPSLDKTPNWTNKYALAEPATKCRYALCFMFVCKCTHPRECFTIIFMFQPNATAKRNHRIERVHAWIYYE